MLLPDNRGQLIRPAYGQVEFYAEAIERLPELAPEISKCVPLIHPVMGLLAGAARQAIATDDRVLLRALFAFLEDVFGRQDVDEEIENAVQISFLTADDFFGDQGRRAWEMVPTLLAAKIRAAV